MQKCHVYRDKNWIIEFKIYWRKSIKEDNVLVGHAVDLAVLMGWTSCQTSTNSQSALLGEHVSDCTQMFIDGMSNVEPVTKMEKLLAALLATDEKCYSSCSMYTSG